MSFTWSWYSSGDAAKVIYLIRHCEAEHNVGNRFHIRDPPLTELGRQQARELHSRLSSGVGDEGDAVLEKTQLVVTSPFKRTLQTTLIGLETVLSRTGVENVVLLPHAQECNIHPCDTGSPTCELAADAEFQQFDFSSLSKERGWPSKEGFWSNDPACLRARAKYVRRWLRDRPERYIILVSHGNFMRYIRHGKRAGELFANGEVRSCTFASENDEDAWLVELETKAKVGEVAATSDEMCQ